MVAYMPPIADALMDYWAGRRPLTGITEPALLRASHIVPWSDCFKLDVMPKGQKRIHLDEVGLYTVRNARIVEESFFMGGR